MTRMELDQFVAEYGTETTSPLPFKEAVREVIRKDGKYGQNRKTDDSKNAD